MNATRSRRGGLGFAAGILAVIGLGSGLSAQQAAVRGTVVNANTEEPIVGATVTVEGTEIRVLTNARGEFAVFVPDAEGTLVVSSVGFAGVDVALNGRTSVVVRMTEEAIGLDEIVVVGYGTQRRSDVTGAVATVDADRLTRSAATSVEQALQGAAPGVSVTNTSAGAEPNHSVILRGRNSIKANNEPLVVIDGIPYQGSISEINQSDVSSINVLKDASAAAIYGSRGSNGVILIETRQGGGAPRITYDGYVGVTDVSELPRLMNGPEFAEFKCQRLNGGEDCESVLTATELANLETGRTTDWVDLATRTGVQQQHSLSFAGGSDGTRYYLAASLLDTEGVARNDAFERYALRVNLDQDIHSWLTIGTSTQMTVTDRSGVDANFGEAFFMNPLTNAYEEDGETQAITPWPEDVFWNNPLQGLLVVDDDHTRRLFTSNYIQLNAPFLEGLSLRFNGGIDYANGDLGRYFGRDTRTGERVQGRAITENATRFDWTAENILHFDRSFGAHAIDATALFSLQGTNLEVDSLRSEGFPSDVLTYYQANVGALLLPSNTATNSRLISQMFRLNYGYDDRYLVTLTARRDGFSGFGENQKYSVFPSLAFAWNVTNERFAPAFFSALRLRASIGQNGNQAIQPYQTLARLDDQSYVEGDLTAPGFIPVTLGNPDLKWETTTALNVGVDFGLFGNRLSGSIDVYRAQTEDLLLDRLISPVHGITRIASNIGETRNQGVELQLSSLNLDRADLSWRTELNLSVNRNEIIDLYGNGEDDVLNDWFIGKPIDVNYGYEFAGIWQEGDDIASSPQPTAQPGNVRIRDVNGDGQINPDDRTFIGSLEPSFTAGLSNTLRYKRLSLTAFLYTVQGVKRANNLLSTNLVHAEVRRNTTLQEFWTPENPINTYPANRDDANPLGVAFYEDASFIRLKDVTLSYDLPETFTGRLGMQSLQLYVTGRNLWTHSDWTGLDPELNSQRAIPLERTLVTGLHVQF